MPLLGSYGSTRRHSRFDGNSCPSAAPATCWLRVNRYSGHEHPEDAFTVVDSARHARGRVRLLSAPTLHACLSGLLGRHSHAEAREYRGFTAARLALIVLGSDARRRNRILLQTVVEREFLQSETDCNCRDELVFAASDAGGAEWWAHIAARVKLPACVRNHKSPGSMRLWVGFRQACAWLMPRRSRSGTTITGGAVRRADTLGGGAVLVPVVVAADSRGRIERALRRVQEVTQPGTGQKRARPVRVRR